MEWWHFMVLALATWRATSLLADEEGPFGVFEKMRLALGIVYLENGTRQAGEKMIRWKSLRYLVQEIAKGVLCVWCCSIWMGAMWIILYVMLGVPVVYVAGVFACSTVTAWIDKRIWVGHRR